MLPSVSPLVIHAGATFFPSVDPPLNASKYPKTPHRESRRAIRAMVRNKPMCHSGTLRAPACPEPVERAQNEPRIAPSKQEKHRPHRHVNGDQHQLTT